MKRILFLLPLLFASCSSNTNGKTAKNDAVMQANMAISEAQMDLNDLKNEFKNLKVQYFGFDKKIEGYLSTLTHMKEQMQMQEITLKQIESIEEKLTALETTLKEQGKESSQVKTQVSALAKRLEENQKKMAQLEDTLALAAEKIKLRR